MTEFSITVTIIGVIQLAGKVTSLGYGYIGGVQRAPKELRELVDELAALSKVLIAMQDYTDKNPTSEVIHSLNIPKGPLQGCARELEILQMKLEPKGGDGLQSVMEDGVEWPLNEDETKQYTVRVARLKDIFELSLKPEPIGLEKEIKDYSEDMSLAIHHLRKDSAALDSWQKREEALRAEEKRENVLNWLYPEDFEMRHNEISNRRQKDTGNWLVKRSEFTDWLMGTPPSPYLWGYGIPGVGKTFLSSVIIDYFPSGPLAETVNYGLAYIYFDYKEQNRQEPEHIIANLVKQLGSQTLGLPLEIQDLHDRLTPERKRPTYEELFTALLSTFESFDRVYFVVDALDEIESLEKRKKFLDLFHRISQYGTRIFMGSRRDDRSWDIEAFLVDIGAVQVELLADEDDIRSYISEKIDENPRAKRLVQQGKSKEKIIEALADCAKGMFLLVHFHLEYICQQTTAKQILYALEKLKGVSDRDGPLDPTYDRAMENLRRQPKNCSDLAIKVLIWLAKTRRVLTVDEIQVAVSIEAKRLELDELDLPDRTTLLDVCGSLVTIDEQSETIRLSHYTVSEYLLKSYVVPQFSDETVSVALMTYLGFSLFNPGVIPTKKFLERLQLQPFLSYVVTQIPYHLKSCSEESTLEITLKFLENPGNIAAYLQASSYCNAKLRGDILVPEFPTDPVDVPAFPTQPPLHVATALGHLKAVQALVDKGVEVSARDSFGQTALHEATYAGHFDVFKYLLDQGIEVSTADQQSRSALQIAAALGHEEMVQLLLVKGADVSTCDSKGQNALHRAALGGYMAIVQMLLEGGIDFTIKDSRGHTALLEAASGGHEAIVKLLLEKGADITVLTTIGQSALHLATHDGYHNVVRLLLENSLDITIADKDGQTALHIAAARGHGEVVEVLLEYGADIQGFTNAGDSVLHRAVIYGQRAVAMYLLQKGADNSAKDRKGRTSLEIAESTRREQLAMVLKGNGAEAEITEAIERERLVQVLKGNLGNVVDVEMRTD